jgi:Kelch motif protein/dockerin type I repeat protein
MKKQIITAISTRLIPAACLLILPFLLGPALGQGNASKRSVAANLSQAAPPSTGAISAPSGVPAKPTSPKIPAIPKSQLPTNGVALPAPSEATGPWTLGTPYPTTIVRYGFAQTATDFYVFGGVSDGTRVNNVNRMDIATGVWQSRAPMPFTSEAPTCALMASTGIVYCAEGDTGNGFASYNIATDTWTTLAPDPLITNHYGSASGAFNGKVFVAGGSTSFSSVVAVYDVATNTWSAGTAAPNDFLLAGYQQVGQYLYIVGGFEASGPNTVAAELSSVLSRGRQPKQPVPLANNTTTWRLDMSSAPGVWTVGPAFTGARADFGLAYDAGTNTLYAMGGDATGGGFFDSTNLVDELSVASWPGGSWMASPPVLLSPNRQANQAGFNGAGQIWSVGGIVGQTFQFLSEVQRRTNGGGGGCNGSKIYDIAGFGAAGQTNTTRIYDIGTNTWTTGAPLPDSLSDLATAYWNGKIYVAGGYNGAATSALYIYDIASNSWTTGAPMPTAVYLPGFGIINAKLYVASGNNGSTEQSALQVYDIASNTWSTGPVVPTPVTGPGSAVYQGKLYLFGGAAPFPTTITTTQIYDPGTNSWSSGPAMNVARLWFYGGAVDATSIVAPGGDNSPGIPINDNEQLTAGWTVKAPLPFASRGPFAVSDGTVVYIGGGYDGSTVHADLLRYDPVANTYTPLASSPDVHFLSQAVLVSCAPMASDAFSRKVHGGAGTFDIPLPLTGNVGVECRIGPTYQMIIDFATSVTVQSASVTSGTGNVSSFSVNGSQVTVNLSGVTDQQRITMTLHGVNNGNVTGDVPISMGVLIGDVNGNGAVSAADVALTKSQVGATVGGSNFREDVNVNGTISSTDVALVKSDVGHALPP